MKNIFSILLAISLAAAQPSKAQIRVEADSFWLLGQKTAGGKLNFSNGSTLAGVGTQLIDTLGQRWMRTYVDRSLPKVGLNYRDEGQHLPADSSEVSMFYRWKIRTVDFKYENRNFGITQFKQGPNYPQIVGSVRPVSGRYVVSTVIQFDTLHTGQTSPQKTTTYYHSDFKGENDSTEFVYQVKWAADYTGWTKLYIDGKVAPTYVNGVLMDSIPGANLDKAYNPSARQMPYWRFGQYQHTWGDIAAAPVYTQRTILYKNVAVYGASTPLAQALGRPLVAPTPPAPATPVLLPFYFVNN